MSYKIFLPLSRGWSVEEETFVEEGAEVTSWYAYNDAGSNIELYVGELPPDSSAKQECINNYLEVLADDDCRAEDAEVYAINYCGRDAWYYDAADEDGHPVVVISVEINPGVLCLAILSAKDAGSLDDLMGLVDANLRVE